MQRNRRNLKLKALQIYTKKKEEEAKRKEKLNEIKEKLKEEKKKKEEEERIAREKQIEIEMKNKMKEAELMLKKKEQEELKKMLEDEEKMIEKIKKKKEEERLEQERILKEEEERLIIEEEQSKLEEKRLNTFLYNENPSFLYIDYSEDYIEIAKNMGYKTVLINRKDGITSKIQRDILNRTDLKSKNPNVKFNIIINCWKVLTRSNLNSMSFDSTNYTEKKMSKKINDTLRWGNKQYLKNRLTIEQKKHYHVFYEGIPEFIEQLYKKNYNIFIISNSNYSFVKDIFKHYKLKKYIEAIFTPSVCGLPSGSVHGSIDSYNDKRKINKERVFTCIEKYVGRMY